MQDGIYHIALRSPMGIKKGSAEIRSQKGRIVLNLLGGDNLFTGNFVPECAVGEFVFQMTGSLKTALYHLPASLRGRISGDQLQAMLYTETGNFPMEGVFKHE